MAKVLFFLQLIVVLVVLPLWPGVDPRYSYLGMVFLGLVLCLPAAAVVAVYGYRVGTQALIDAWSSQPLGPQSTSSVEVWELVIRTFPLSGMLGGVVAVVGALGQVSPSRPPLDQALVLGTFGLLWGLLGLLLGRILGDVVKRLSLASRPPLLVVTPALSKKYGLTPREVEVAQAVLDGLTYQGASEKLFISPATVKSHVLSVYQKTGAGNKIELLRLLEAENQRIHQTVDGPRSPSGRS